MYLYTQTDSPYLILCSIKFQSIKKFQLDDEDILDSGKFQYLDGLLPDLKDMVGVAI